MQDFYEILDSEGYSEDDTEKSQATRITSTCMSPDEPLKKVVEKPQEVDVNRQYKNVELQKQDIVECAADVLEINISTVYY